MSGGERREVEVYAQRPEQSGGRWTSGSGYLLAGRLVLTAAHVVCFAGRPLDTVRVRAETGALAIAAVVWHRFGEDTDLALLDIIDPAWKQPRWRRPVRWGRFVTERTRQKCEAVGFPHVVATPARRDTHQAVGILNPRSLLKSGLYAVEIENPPDRSGVDRSAWQGMSGAGVLSSDLLVGVVTTDPAGFGSRRLVAVPITTALADPHFAAVVAEHIGASPVLEPVELVGLIRSVSPSRSPAELLRAEAAVMPFRDRPELGQLLDWCDEPDWSSVRLVTGPGGQGKTRLARRLAAELRTPAGGGWATVNLRERAEAAAVLDLTVLADVTVPTLVVVDYAEGRADDLAALVAAMNEADATVRLLLLARTAGAWRTEQVDPARHLEVLADDAIVVNLGPVEPAPAGRGEAWTQAVDALAPQLAALEGSTHIAWTDLTADLRPPELDGDRYHTILGVQMDALATLLQAGDPLPAVGHPDARNVLLAHESRYWERVATQFGVTVQQARTRRCLVAAATLWGARSAGEAEALLAGFLPDKDTDSRGTVADWLATLYHDDQRYWAAMQPDPLGEYLVGTVLAGDRSCPTLVSGVISRVSPDQLEHGLTVLGRAHPEHPHLADVITEVVVGAGENGGKAAIAVAPRLANPQPLLSALEDVIDATDGAALLGLNEAFPHFSLVLGSASLKAVAARVAEMRNAAENDRDTYLPILAEAVTNLAVRLEEAGRGTEALVSVEEAIELNRELVALGGSAHLRALAGSLHNFGRWLGKAGRRAEALLAVREAVDLFRELVEYDRGAYLSGLAAAMDNLAVRLQEEGHGAEALVTVREAVRYYRELTLLDRDIQLPGLAGSMNDLAAVLHSAGRDAEALAAAREAVDLHRELADHNRDTYLPTVATSVNNLAVLLAVAELGEEALAASTEAVELRRELVRHNRASYLPELAMSVSNLAIRLDTAGMQADALAATLEAVDLYEEAVALDRETNLPALASAMQDLALRLDTAGQGADALGAAQDSVDLYWEVVDFDDREEHIAELAKSTSILASYVYDAGQHARALAATEDVVDLCRELVELDHGAHLPDLALSVLNLATLLAEVDRQAEAVPFAREASDYYRGLACADPVQFGTAAEQADALVASLLRPPLSSRATNIARRWTRRDKRR